MSQLPREDRQATTSRDANAETTSGSNHQSNTETRNGDQNTPAHNFGNEDEDPRLALLDVVLMQQQHAVGPHAHDQDINQDEADNEFYGDDEDSWSELKYTAYGEDLGEGLFFQFITHRETQAAFRELDRDYLSRESNANIHIQQPHRGRIQNLVKLCELEPFTWCYNKPNPNKGTWTVDAHFTRFSIRLQVVRRQLLRTHPGPLENWMRAVFVDSDIYVANFLQKMQAAHASYIPNSADVVTAD
ncbi:hypothetical protein BGZ63DRAFT_436936 [Mariannaea sp. PMI_226]|nr:hypothetical protein BGZ63DRAFT_436936 [Mariannaea sp. PMI_226]